mgnify:CR=1 FL=1
MFHVMFVANHKGAGEPSLNKFMKGVIIFIVLLNQRVVFNQPFRDKVEGM